MSQAKALIQALALQPHPEGGWYRETWRAPSDQGQRSPGTAILYLLEQEQRSHWHRVDAAELWLFHAGAPLALLTANDAGEVSEARLGADVMGGCAPQRLVEPHQWQAAEAREGWSLVACVVVPGFAFEGFELAAPGWRPGAA